MKKYMDSELLDWLEKQDGCALVSDDAGRWAISTDGSQNMSDPKKPIDVWNTILVEAKDWRPNIRAAIRAAISNSPPKER